MQPTNLTFIVTGNIVGGLPEFQLPPFGINRTSTVNDPTFGEIMTELGSVIATLPMVSTLCQVAIAKAFGKATYNLFLNKGLFPASFSYLFVSWCNFCKVKSVDFGSGIKDSQSRRRGQVPKVHSTYLIKIGRISFALNHLT